MALFGHKGGICLLTLARSGVEWSHKMETRRKKSMKRIIALIITLILSCSAVSALAAGNIQATEDTAS